MEIIGRQLEIQTLNKVYNSNEAELLAVYGRRRIGKTFLVNEFFKNKGFYFELTGIKDASLTMQLQNFANEMADVFYGGEMHEAPQNWQSAFTQLRHELTKLDSQQRIILFFDELPWLASRGSDFLQALDHCWNRYLSRNKQILVIVCGSAASWMINNVIQNKGGLHGRVTRELRLLPFNLAETESYLKHRNILLDRKQIIDLYMAIGGVPKYLSYVEPGKSAAQTINELCFMHPGPLSKEFNKLYRSLFNGAERHIAIIKALAKKRIGLSQDELLKQIGMSSGGTVSNIINELEESGFIAYLPRFGKSKNKGRYTLIDEYSLFYMTWMAGLPRIGLGSIDNDYWLKKQASNTWKSWSGYAFESVCLKHIEQIKKALGIEAVNTDVSTWFYKPATKHGDKGAQIDLLIDRADNCINLCELKYHSKELALTQADARALLSKKTVFQQRTQTKKTIFITLLTSYGAKENAHYLQAVTNQLTIDALFADLNL